MNCERTRDMLADYLGEELAPAERQAFDSHLSACERCRSDVDSLQAAVCALRQLDPPPTPLAAPQPAPRRPVASIWPGGAFQPLAYAAMLLIGVGIGWIARPAPENPSPGGSTGPDTPAVVDTTRQQSRPNRLNPLVRNAIALSTAFSRPKDR